MSTPEILMPRPMLPLVAEALAQAGTLHKLWEMPDPDAFLAQSGAAIRAVATGSHLPIDGAFLDRLPNCEIVASFGVGYDHVDTAAAAARGIVVTNTPDVLTEEVADLTLGLLLMTVRRLGAAERYLRAGSWLERPFPLTDTLRDKRVGILGYGRIGKAIARRLDAFGVEIVYHGRRPQEGVPHAYVANLHEMAKAVDILVSVAPGGAATRHMIDASVLAALGPTGTLINVGRGSVVDEAALVEALEAGRLGAAGLDVFEDEPRVPQALIARDDVVLLPHVGSATIHTRSLMARLVVDNILSWLAGKGPLTPVPETPVRAAPE